MMDRAVMIKALKDMCWKLNEIQDQIYPLDEYDMYNALTIAIEEISLTCDLLEVRPTDG